MARNKSPIPLKIREYNRKKLDIHEYKSLIIDRGITEYLLEGEK